MRSGQESGSPSPIVADSMPRECNAPRYEKVPTNNRKLTSCMVPLAPIVSTDCTPVSCVAVDVMPYPSICPQFVYRAYWKKNPTASQESLGENNDSATSRGENSARLLGRRLDELHRSLSFQAVRVDLETPHQVAQSGGLGTEFFTAGSHLFASGGGLLGNLGDSLDRL